MIEKIKSMVIDQIRLIEPIAKYGATSIIRKSANDTIDNLYKIIDSQLLIEDFIKNNRDTLIECCISLYTRLSDDSRTLPTIKLKELSKTESDNIMEMWKYIENFK